MHFLLLASFDFACAYEIWTCCDLRFKGDSLTEGAGSDLLSDFITDLLLPGVGRIAVGKAVQTLDLDQLIHHQASGVLILEFFSPLVVVGVKDLETRKPGGCNVH